ncbi:hypothetical protein PORY_001401 [Pneumocystis oryctolagi]|uniref:Uncharacterized protein n=1 Tax=Pneumocystis oryctolagi TaxID=42067 RepID=A0ACB7CCF3_9ASCO|nr:hypothetical protein PORY_001401 [Pneumocystis oryctolagi]
MEHLEQFSTKSGVQEAVFGEKEAQLMNNVSKKGYERSAGHVVAKEACETVSGVSQTVSLVEGGGSRAKKKKKKRTKQKLVEDSGSMSAHLESCCGAGDFPLSECKQARESRFLNEPEYDPASPNLSFPLHREPPLTASFSSSSNLLGPIEKKTLSRKKKKKKKTVIGDSYHSPIASDGAVHPPPQYRMASRKQKDQIWNISTHEERERIKEFWLQLGEEERRGLVKIEKEAVLRKMKEQQKHSCSCSVCDRKRIAIEEELEVLYDAYYEELEQYANQQQKFSSLSLLRKNSLSGRPEDLEDSEGMLDSDGDYDESILSEGVDPRFDFFNFGNSLTVKGGILTVADDLLKNDGKKFIEMMEQLAERRIQREEEAVMEIETTEFDSDDEDYDEESDDEMNTLDEEQRIEEGRKMFQIFAARMFEQRVLTAYREKVAEERQQRLLEELEEENRLKEERELKKAKEKERKKDKKKLQKQLKDQEKARKEAERLAEENALRAEEEKRLEEAKKKKEELRLKREIEKKALEEEKQRQIQDKEKEHEKEKKRKEAEKERYKKELNAKKEKEVKEVKETQNKLRNPKEKNENEQIVLENIQNNITFVNQSPQTKNQDSFYGITELIKETRSPVSSSLNSSSVLSLKTEHESDNSLSSSSLVFSQSSIGLQNTSQKSPHISSSSSNFTLQHPPGFDTTPNQNFSSTHSTYQPLTSPHSIINSVSTGIFSSTSTISNQQYDYSLSPLKLFKTVSNNYKNETSSFSTSLNNYHSLPITPTTAFPRPFHHIEDKDHNNTTKIHETRSKVLDDNTVRIVPGSSTKPIKRPSPIQRPSGTTSYKDESRKTPTINELSEVMGSKALLDDDDSDSIIPNHINDIPRGLSARSKPVFQRNSPFLDSINLNRHVLNSQESQHRNTSDQSWLSGLLDFRFPDIWSSNTNWNNQYCINLNLLRQRCKLICLRLDEQYGSKTRLFLVDQVLNLYNDLFSDTPVQTKQILDACAISGNSQNGGGFFTCKVEGQHVMIRYDDVLDQTSCKFGFSGFPTMCVFRLDLSEDEMFYTLNSSFCKEIDLEKAVLYEEKSSTKTSLLTCRHTMMSFRSSQCSSVECADYYSILSPKSSCILQDKIPLIESDFRSHELRKRQEVASEILDTERSYLGGLYFILNYFVNPILDSLSTPTPILSRARISDIFSNFIDILNLNTELLRMLEERLDPFNTGTVCHWDPENDCLGDIFLQMGPFMKMYSIYCRNFSSALGAIEHEFKDNSVFNAFMMNPELKKVCNGLDLQSRLLSIVQRIPRYKLLIYELLRYTDKNHKDYETLSKAFCIIEEVVLLMDKTIKQHENWMMMLRIQRSLFNLDEPLLSIPSRYFIKQGFVYKFCRRNRQKKKLFLFSDCLIYATPVTFLNISEETFYYFNFRMSLDTLYIDDRSYVTKGINNAWKISNSSKTLSVCCNSQKEKEEWMAIIESTKKEYLIAKKTFRVICCKNTRDLIKSSQRYLFTVRKKKFLFLFVKVNTGSSYKILRACDLCYFSKVSKANNDQENIDESLLNLNISETIVSQKESLFDRNLPTINKTSMPIIRSIRVKAYGEIIKIMFESMHPGCVMGRSILYHFNLYKALCLRYFMNFTSSLLIRAKETLIIWSYNFTKTEDLIILIFKQNL